MSVLELVIALVGVATLVTVVTLFLNRKPLSGITNDSDVVHFIEKGDTLTAIKAYRQLHGVSLKEAKQFIKQHEQNKTLKD